MADVDFPVKLQCLFQPKRYKILYGGRAGTKSWGVARALLIRGYQGTERILCARQQQNSMAQSVHKLLSDQIVALGLSHHYEIQRDKIIGTNGTTFAFEGIHTNVDRIKSYEGITICWVEEANKVTEESWLTLIPTIIRNVGAEIWITFNPELETDYTYQNFVLHPPKESFVVFLTYRDNPWLTQEVLDEIEELKQKDYDAYLNVWEGQCRILLAGAVYATELRKVAAEQRITRVPYDPRTPVDTFWDLGWADATAIWFRQRVGFEWHYIDYLENRQQKLEWYLHELQQRPYLYGTHWLPHDAKAKQLGTGLSIYERVRKVHSARVVRKIGLEDGIAAARTLLGDCWFDKERTAVGVRALQQYRYEVVDGVTGALSRRPVHDASSHGADAFRASAVAIKQPRTEKAEMLEERLDAAGFKRTNRSPLDLETLGTYSCLL